MDELSAPAVVVGIDGSRFAVDTALWAVDEAVSRDIPLRLVCGIDPATRRAPDPQTAAQALATAELAVRYAFAAVESTEQPVKIEMEILQQRPAKALLEASRSAAMICIGAVGLSHALPGGVGSTAAALLRSAHCPVVIVRETRRMSAAPGWILVEVDESVDSDVALECGFEEARLRSAPLHVLQAWRPRFTDVRDPDAAVANNREVKTGLDRRLVRWRRRYPQVDLHAVAVQGSTVGYLARNAEATQLIVVSAGRCGGPAELVGPDGMTVLRDTGCSVLVCNRHRTL